MSWYAIGTAAVTNNSGAVVGTGTTWVANVQAGDIFWGPDGRGYEVVAVNSNTSLTIGPAYAGATAGGQAYRIAPTQGRVITLTDGVNQLLTQFGGIRDGIGSGNFPDGTAAAPALRFGADTDTGLYRPGANILAIATGGVERLRVVAEKIGIGTGGPISKLHVHEASTDPSVIWAGNTNNGAAVGMITSTVGGIGAHNNHLVAIFGTAGSAPVEIARFQGAGVASGAVSTPTRLAFDTTYAATSTPSNQQLKINLVPASANEGYGWSVDNIGRLWHHAGSSVGPTGSHVFATGNSGRWEIVTAGHFQPVIDNAYAFGGASTRPTVIFAASGTINTSDQREKTWRGAATTAELMAARRIIAELGFYQWNAAIAEKGPLEARFHFGARAQAVWAIMADEGLIDPIAEGVTPSAAYAFLCYDQWDAVAAVEEVRDEDDNIIVAAQPARPAGNRFGIRPDQLALFLIASQEARLAALEAAA